jgi:hypothetical protein
MLSSLIGVVRVGGMHRRSRASRGWCVEPIEQGLHHGHDVGPSHVRHIGILPAAAQVHSNRESGGF